MSTLLSAAVVAAVGDLKCALLCRRLAEDCKGLWLVFINADTNTCQTLLQKLRQAELGGNSRGYPRFIRFYVPGR